MRRITWIGHATVLVETGGVRLLTDPVLRTRMLHLKRQVEPVADPAQLDAVLVSHVHYDHLDRPSLRRVAGPGVAAVVPVGATRLVSGLSFGAIHEVRAGGAVDIGGVSVEAVPAWHDGRRLPGTKELDTLGFVIDGIWFAGDTDLNDEMAELRGRVELALVPIWGWGPSLGPGHLDPERAAHAVALVQPEIAVPIHWGTYLPIGLAPRKKAQLLTMPAEQFAAHAAKLAPSTRVETIQPGGSLDL